MTNSVSFSTEDEPDKKKKEKLLKAQVKEVSPRLATMEVKLTMIHSGLRIFHIHTAFIWKTDIPVWNSSTTVCGMQDRWYSV